MYAIIDKVADEVGTQNAKSLLFKTIVLALELETNDMWNQHRDRLSEHCRFCLDAADAPAQNSEAVDHRRV